MRIWGLLAASGAVVAVLEQLGALQVLLEASPLTRASPALEDLWFV